MAKATSQTPKGQTPNGQTRTGPQDPNRKGRRQQAEGRGADRKRRSGLRALASDLPAVTKRAFARRGLSGAELARQWPAIVGADLSRHCRPRRLRFRRPGETREGELTLRVAPGWALEIQHLETLLLERVNGFFGYRAVERLTLQQGPLPQAARLSEVRPAATPPPPDKGLVDKLARIDDPELREALERLGRAVRQKHDRRPERA
ncbi:DUF721 domain-containing protein [Pelagibius sp.]|uniref:DUF721 domain-containing protein n=1 Tax=Pelagibius sp. TaxID=1931238 RepID=UPI003B5004FB